MGTAQATGTITVLVMRRTPLTEHERDRLRAVLGYNFKEEHVTRQPNTEEGWSALCDERGDDRSVVVVIPNGTPPRAARYALDVANFNHIFFDSRGEPQRVVLINEGTSEPYKGIVEPPPDTE